MKRRSLRVFACAAMLTLGLSITACGKMTLDEYVSSKAAQAEMDTIKKELEGTGMSIDVKVDGNKMTYVYTFDDIENAEGMEETLNEGLDAEAETFKTTAASIGKVVGDDSVIIGVEYVDKNGDVICSREFTAE